MCLRKDVTVRLLGEFLLGTLTVNVSVLLLSLASPDESSLKYEVEILLQQQWYDPRLKYGNQSRYEYLNAIHHYNDIWLPDTYFIMHGDFKDPVILVHFSLKIHRNGTVNYLMRRHLILSCQGSLHIFPFDDPLCTFAMKSISYEQSMIQYVWMNGEDVLRKSPSLKSLNAYLIENQTSACPTKSSWRGIIKCVTGVTVHCCGMWWPSNTFGGLLNTVCFMSLSGLTLYNFLSAVFHGPGYLPYKWAPEEEGVVNLQFCQICDGYKAPRSHHCRKCQRCVLKMDHHCPWINNCVGWGNHAHFTLFLTFAVLGCLHASIILSCSLYGAFHRSWYIYYGTGKEPIVTLGLYGIVVCVFALGLALGVVIAVGMLLFFQLRAIVRNRTGIEDWIVEKANHRRKGTDSTFVFPYDLGVVNNVGQVLNFQSCPVGDGITWQVREGCDQYTLTREQIEQKLSKRQRTRPYVIVRPTSGSWVPITQGLGVCMHPPFTDEPRLKLEVGDKLLVTRWRKYWLFGEKVDPDMDPHEPRKKGWFPRRCGQEVFSDEGSQSEKKLL